MIGGNMAKYKAVSQEAQSVFAQFDPEFEMMSLDEGYLDITDYLAAHRLTCSGGIGCNRMLGKLAGEVNKPNGQLLIPFDRESILRYMAGVPVKTINGRCGRHAHTHTPLLRPPAPRASRTVRR